MGNKRSIDEAEECSYIKSWVCPDAIFGEFKKGDTKMWCENYERNQASDSRYIDIETCQKCKFYDNDIWIK